MFLLKKYNNIKLTVVGDGIIKDEFLKRVQELDLSKSINWIGKIPHSEVKAYYASHDVFFFTSLRDSCPAQLIEALAYGMPIVTLNLHGQSLIVNNETGFRCNCSTPEIAIQELHDAILKLYFNPTLVREMSIAAHQFALNQTWDKKIKTIVETYYPKL